jgi:ATP-dependent DNA ligase
LHSDFDALRNSEASSGATLVAFDVLEVEGFDFRDQSLKHRRAMLGEQLAPIPHGILLSEAVEGRLRQTPPRYLRRWTDLRD